MKILRSIALYLALLVVIAIAYLLVADPKYTVTITQAQVQQAINAKLPYSPPPRHFIEYTVNQGATVEFRQDGHIAVSGTFTAKPTLTKTSHFDGHIAAVGNLVYEGGAFYIRNLELEDFGGNVVLSERAQAAEKLLGNLKNKIMDKLDMTPKDTEDLLGLEKLKENLPRYLSEKLATLPVYKLDGKKWWHSLASSSLENLSVSNQTITIQLGLGKMLLSVLLSLGIVIMATMVTIAIIYSGPEGLVGLLLFSAAT